MESDQLNPMNYVYDNLQKVYLDLSRIVPSQLVFSGQISLEYQNDITVVQI